MKTKITALLFAAALLPLSANALTINSDILPNGVDLTYINVANNATVYLEVTAADFGTNPFGLTDDPVLTLFNDDGNLTADDFVQQAIIGGTGNLPAFSRGVNGGDFVVAVTNYFSPSNGNNAPPTPAEVIAGTGLFLDTSTGITNTYTLEITGTTPDGQRPVPIMENNGPQGGGNNGGGGTPGADVPEPTTLALLGLGLAGIGAARRRKTS